MYEFGEGVPIDYQKAFHWYWLSASQGEAGAQYSLGRLFYGGLGMQSDLMKAYKWFFLADLQCHSGTDRYLRRIEKQLHSKIIDTVIKEALDSELLVESGGSCKG